jgi:phosphohistidine phosphatase
MRHGDAVAATENRERRLSRRGRQGVEDTARAALERGTQVSRIYHSGILRARETAAIMAEYLIAPSGVAFLAGLAPEDDPMIAKAELEAAEEPILLVSHLPLLSRLAAVLVHGDFERPAVEFFPATLACVAKSPARWEIRWRITP